MNPPKSRRPPRTIKNLASALCLSTKQIQNLLKQGMPETIPEALAWRDMKTNGTDGDTSAAELRRQKILLTAQHVRLATVKADTESGKLLAVRDVVETVCAVIHQTKSEFIRLQEELPPRLSGLSEPKMRAIIRAEIYSILDRLSKNLLTKYQNDESTN
jgi:hypothetical protein